MNKKPQKSRSSWVAISTISTLALAGTYALLLFLSNNITEQALGNASGIIALIGLAVVVICVTGFFKLRGSPRLATIPLICVSVIITILNYYAYWWLR